MILCVTDIHIDVCGAVKRRVSQIRSPVVSQRMGRDDRQGGTRGLEHNNQFTHELIRCTKTLLQHMGHFLINAIL